MVTCSPCLCVALFPPPNTHSVPAAVSGLRLDNNGSSHSLQASWLSAEGGVDMYLVTLSAPGSTAQQRRLPPNITQVQWWNVTKYIYANNCISLIIPSFWYKKTSTTLAKEILWFHPQYLFNILSYLADYIFMLYQSSAFMFIGSMKAEIKNKNRIQTPQI